MQYKHKRVCTPGMSLAFSVIHVVACLALWPVGTQRFRELCWSSVKHFLELGVCKHIVVCVRIMARLATGQFKKWACHLHSLLKLPGTVIILVCLSVSFFLGLVLGFTITICGKVYSRSYKFSETKFHLRLTGSYLTVLKIGFLPHWKFQCPWMVFHCYLWKSALFHLCWCLWHIFSSCCDGRKI